MAAVAIRALAALLMSFMFIGGVQAQSPNYFYCFARDPDSGTVLMSQTLPAGPVGERKNYGLEFAKFLLESGRVKTTVTGYCTMRPTAADVDRSRFMLPQESCPVCAGADGFQNVTWPRDKLIPPQREMNAAIAAVTPPKPPAVKPPAAPEPAEPEFVLVVMANAETGELEFGHGETKKDVGERARAKRATGWSTLVTSTSAGYGAAFCVENKGKTQFFVAADRDFREEALREAVKPALAHARKTGSKTALCGKWRARFPGAEQPAPEPDDYWIELLQGLIREMVATCKTPAKCGDDDRFVTIGVRG